MQLYLQEELFDITKLQQYDGIDLSMVRSETDELNREVWMLVLYITKPQNEWQVTSAYQYA